MTDAIISAVVEQVTSIITDKIRKEVNLVRGVKKELRSLSGELNTIRNVLGDAERRRFKEDSTSVKDWLMRLEGVAYEMDDVLDEWNFTILKLQIEQSDDDANLVRPFKYKVRSFIMSRCLCFNQVTTRHHTATKIEGVKAKLGAIMAEKDRYGLVITSQPIDSHRPEWRVQSTPLIDLDEVCGRNIESENLVSELVAEQLGIHIISIVGVGGLGKTTLAKLAYNDSRVESTFDLKIWMCVSDPFDGFEIANEIIKGAGGSKPDSNQLGIVVEGLKKAILGRKFLLVLDDVWTENYSKWEPLKTALKFGGVGSKILVTTRNEKVAVMMGSVKNEIHHLGQLSNEDCWLLLRRIAISGVDEKKSENFQEIGKAIAIKCKGLPLAAKTLGSLLQFKYTLEEWKSVLHSEIWQLEKAEVELFPHLFLSYNELSPTLKLCFSYCAVFPKDSEIHVETLITQWMALGYLGSGGDWVLRGIEYWNKLAMCSLFQDFEKYEDEHIESFKLHDIIHDFAQYIRKNGGIGAEMEETTCKTCSSSLVSHAKQYRSLFCKDESPLPQLCDCLTSVRLLNLRGCDLQSIPIEIEKLIHLRWLDVGYNSFPPGDLKSICKLYNLQFLWLDKCHLEEIPHEIGNLIRLKFLNLAMNTMTKLPDGLCNLQELESLEISKCRRLSVFPRGIDRLENLKHLCNDNCDLLKQFPSGLAQLLSLRTLENFHVGRDWGKLGWLKNLNQLDSFLELYIEVSEGLVEDAREAELNKKVHIDDLQILFNGSEGEKSVAANDVLDALEPHPNLRIFKVHNYWGSRFPGWIVSPLNQLREVKLANCKYLSSFPPMGKLPFLETLNMDYIPKVEFVGREFLGITTTTEVGRGEDIEEAEGITSVLFPKLRLLIFQKCEAWGEWEDITAEEEHSALISFMPCLTQLTISSCEKLEKLPHRLLRKASSLNTISIYYSTLLFQKYNNMLGEVWKSISHPNPHLRLDGW